MFANAPVSGFPCIYVYLFVWHLFDERAAQHFHVRMVCVRPGGDPVGGGAPTLVLLGDGSYSSGGAVAGHATAMHVVGGTSCSHWSDYGGGSEWFLC